LPDNTPVPTGNEPEPETVTDGTESNDDDLTVLATHPAESFVVPKRTIDLDLTATASPRLVVVTEPLIGHEFVLDGPCFFIGRTQDNTIVLNHDSVSRHHAKVVRTGVGYMIVDLASANGVRVNGIEQSQVELRPGDLITLGLVCLRYGGAADVAVPAASFLPPASWSARRPIALAVMLGLPAAIVLAVVLAPSGRPPAAPATITLPTPPIEDFTHVRDPAANSAENLMPYSTVGAISTPSPPSTPSSGRSAKPSASAATRERAGRRHSSADRDLAEPDQPSPPTVAPLWDQEPPAREPPPPPEPPPATDREPPPRPAQVKPRSSIENEVPRTIDTEDPYPKDP
jgi:hypothetical protein